MKSSLRVWIRDHYFRRYKQLISSVEMRRYFAGTHEPKLNLGAGGNRLVGWLNVDYYPPPNVSYMDGTAPWPFPNEVFHAVHCEHMIEHVDKDAARTLLSEAFRTLKSGGKLRIVTPDLDFFARAALNGAPGSESYLRFVESFTNTTGMNWCDAINAIFHEHDHRYIYTQAELIAALERTGFDDIRVMRAGDARDPLFKGADGHARLVGYGPNSIEAFAVEARKASVRARVNTAGDNPQKRIEILVGEP